MRAYNTADGPSVSRRRLLSPAFNPPGTKLLLNAKEHIKVPSIYIEHVIKQCLIVSHLHSHSTGHMYLNQFVHLNVGNDDNDRTKARYRTPASVSI